MVSAFIDNEKKEILKSILFSENIPTIPAVATSLINKLTYDDVEMSDIAELISMDVGLSSRLLKVVNSSYYGFPNQVASISHAVNLIGLNAVQNLVLSVAFFTLKQRETASFDYHTFWYSSLACAVAAQLICTQCEHLRTLDKEQVFLTGLLQNLGKLVLASTMNKQYRRVEARLESSGYILEDDLVETEYLGIDHPLISYSMTREWGLPDSLVLPLRYHHAPDTYMGENEKVRLNSHVCYLADILTNVVLGRNSPKYHRLFIKMSGQYLDIQTVDVKVILRTIHLEIDQAVDVFGLKTKATKSVEEVLIEANMNLSLLNLSYEEMNRKLMEQQVQLQNLTRELEEKNKILENLAYIDSLTGVNNHRCFQNFLDSEVSRSREQERYSISLLMMDIDRFKLFNDTYGHRVGDFILAEFCKVVGDNIQGRDLLARYGGEEFVIVLPETTLEDTMIAAEKIRMVIENHRFCYEGGVYRVTISIGVANQVVSGGSFSKDELLSAADEALYAAKNGGRNRVELFCPNTL